MRYTSNRRPPTRPNVVIHIQVTDAHGRILESYYPATIDGAFNRARLILDKGLPADAYLTLDRRYYAAGTKRQLSGDRLFDSRHDSPATLKG